MGSRLLIPYIGQMNTYLIARPHQLQQSGLAWKSALTFSRYHPKTFIPTSILWVSRIRNNVINALIALCYDTEAILVVIYNMQQNTWNTLQYHHSYFPVIEPRIHEIYSRPVTEDPPAVAYIFAGIDPLFPERQCFICKWPYGRRCTASAFDSFERAFAHVCEHYEKARFTCSW